jgi:hypothetical protein
LKIRTMPQLRRLARRLWEDQKTARPDAVPQILAGRGAYQSGRWLSYCEGRRKIVLARHERNLRTLIHELTHAIGFGTHGAGFRQRYFALLARYGGPLNAATRKALAVEVKRLAA